MAPEGTRRDASSGAPLGHGTLELDRRAERANGDAARASETDREREAGRAGSVTVSVSWTRHRSFLLDQNLLISLIKSAIA